MELKFVLSNEGSPTRTSTLSSLFLFSVLDSSAPKLPAAFNCSLSRTVYARK